MGSSPSTDDLAKLIGSVLSKRDATPSWLVHAIISRHRPGVPYWRLERALEDNRYTRFQEVANGVWQLRPEASRFDPDLGTMNVPVDVDHPQSLEPWPWQRRALDAWKAVDRRGVVEAVTGTGKTRVGLLAAFQRLREGGKVQVLVPTIVLQRQWLNQFESTLPGLRLGAQGGGSHDSLDNRDVLVSVVNSAAERPAQGLDGSGLLIADECHRYGAPSYTKALDARFQHRMGLTATYERPDDGCEQHLDPYFGGVCFRYPYSLAVPDEVVAPFAVAVMRVDFSPHERREYERWAQKASDAREKLIVECGLPEEPFGEFMKAASALAGSDQYWEPCVKTASQYFKAFGAKRELLAECRAKYDVLPRLAGAVRSASGTLVFTQTIEGARTAAERLRGEDLEAYSVHSGMSDAERDRLLLRFGRGHVDAVCAPKLLDEGWDVPDADLAIILGSTQTERQMIQRMGRILRKKDDGRIARFALLVVHGTPEDPTRGGHQGFLNEIADVCVDLRGFRGCPDEAVDFLSTSRMSDQGSALWAWSQRAHDREISRLVVLEPDPDMHDRTVRISRDSFPDLFDALARTDLRSTEDAVDVLSVPRATAEEAARLARLQRDYRSQMA